MGTFELEAAAVAADCGKRLKQECIIAFKVYDQCRQQDCLTPALLGPARAAKPCKIREEMFREGDVIDPPATAANVQIKNLRLKKVIIVSKEPNQFRPGFWDIDLKFVFRYDLVFREADGTVIGTVPANSIYHKIVTLFGSIGTDIVLASDLLNPQSETLDSDPFVLVEGKAVALAAELKYTKRKTCGPEDLSPTPNAVLVTIGLFTIIKLFRLVNLLVESRGFCVPAECDQVSPLNPCEFFDNLDFPFDIFSPPQKEDFLSPIVDDKRRKKPCGCKE